MAASRVAAGLQVRCRDAVCLNTLTASRGAWSAQPAAHSCWMGPPLPQGVSLGSCDLPLAMTSCVCMLWQGGTQVLLL